MVGRLWKYLSFAFPARCAGCSVKGTWWCQSCDTHVIIIREPVCPRCNRVGTGGRFCTACRRHVALSGLVAGAHLRPPLLSAIHALKYRHTTALVTAVSAYGIIALAHVPPLRDPALVPVPLHPSRLRTRGVNQAALISKTISTATGIPQWHGLRRIRPTPSQTGLSRPQRASNMTRAFATTQTAPRDCILVDDVYTTGATLNACAEALRASGARRVWGVVIAKR